MPEQVPERFCLTANPYASGPPKAEFQPIADSPRMVSAGGYSQLADLDAYLKSRVKKGVAALVLVVGREHTGRTTVARHIVNRYARERAINQAANFLMPIPDQMNHVPMEAIKEWLVGLDLEVARLRITLEGGLADQLEGVCEMTPEQLTNAPPKRLLLQVAQALQAQERAFGVYFDGAPPGSEIIQTATELFAMIPTIVVATETLIADDAGTDVLSHFLKLQREGKGYIVRLGLLDKDEAFEVAQIIWKEVRPASPCPSNLVCSKGQDNKLKETLGEIADCWMKTSNPIAAADWDKAWKSVLKKDRLSIAQLLSGLTFALEEKVNHADGECFPWEPDLTIAEKELRAAFRAVKSFTLT